MSLVAGLAFDDGAVPAVTDVSNHGVYGVMVRFLAFILAIAGGVAGSQAPAFTDQYMQNLTGRVDELRPTVEQFDENVGRYGYTRQRALEECSNADGLLDALCEGYAEIVRRYAELKAHLDGLKAATSLERPIVLARGYQQDILESTYSAYKPAVPTTMDGAVYGGGGFVGLWALGSLVFGGIGALFGGGRRGRELYA